MRSILTLVAAHQMTCGGVMTKKQLQMHPHLEAVENSTCSWTVPGPRGVVKSRHFVTCAKKMILFIYQQFLVV